MHFTLKCCAKVKQCYATIVPCWNCWCVTSFLFYNKLRWERKVWRSPTTTIRSKKRKSRSPPQVQPFFLFVGADQKKIPKLFLSVRPSPISIFTLSRITLSKVLFSDLQGNHFLDHPDTFDQIFDFYSFDFYTFKNKITILKVYE